MQEIATFATRILIEIPEMAQIHLIVQNHKQYDNSIIEGMSCFFSRSIFIKGI